jgi:carboxymethylenebutenolidase
MALNDYLAEEIRVDHADGHLSRREALRMLGMLGLGLSSARAWLAGSANAAVSDIAVSNIAVSDSALSDVAVTKPKAGGKGTATTKKPASRSVATTAKPAAARASPATAAPVGDPAKGALAVTPITFAGPAGHLMASFSAAAHPKGGVLIIHENRGLTAHFRALPGRFARDGYSALAIDLASRSGGTDAVASQMPSPLANAATSDLVADMKAGLDELTRRTPGVKLGVIGFCFGGGMVWNLLHAGDSRIAAAEPFYGVGPSDADFTHSPNAAVLAVYAQLDARVGADRPAMTAALERAKLPHEIVIAPGVDHAFFNDTGPRYNATQAAAVYAKLLAWFGKYLR